MSIGVGVAHYLAPVVVLGCVALAPSTQGAGRAVASFWLALMGWWLATGNECPFSLAYKKARDPGYVTGQNMRAPDLDDLYARIEARWGLPAPAVEAGFGWAMGAALGVGAAHAVAYGGRAPRRACTRRAVRRGSLRGGPRRPQEPLALRHRPRGSQAARCHGTGLRSVPRMGLPLRSQADVAKRAGTTQITMIQEAAGEGAAAPGQLRGGMRRAPCATVRVRVPWARGAVWIGKGRE
jgi:hypothetical protein